jgi:hypothetical protein
VFEDELEEQENRLRQVFKDELKRGLEKHFAVHAAKFKANQKEITTVQDQDVGKSLTTLATKQVEIAESLAAEQTFLRQELEVTKSERDSERAKKRSQAGKISAKTRTLNQSLAKQAEMEENQQKTIENSDVIKEIRRVEDRLHASVDMLMPLGSPVDQLPFDDNWMKQNGFYGAYMEFKENLEANYSKAKLLIRREDLTVAPQFPECAKIRLFMHGVGVVLSDHRSSWNVANSPAKHRFDLTLYSGPIFGESTFNKVRTTMEIHVEFLCNKLSLEYKEDITDYPSIAGDAFLDPEVMHFYFCITVICLVRHVVFHRWRRGNLLPRSSVQHSRNIPRNSANETALDILTRHTGATSLYFTWWAQKCTTPI